MSKRGDMSGRMRALVGAALMAALLAVLAALAYGSHTPTFQVTESEAGAGDSVHFKLDSKQGDSYQIFINDDQLVASGTDGGDDGVDDSFAMPDLGGSTRDVTVDAYVELSDAGYTVKGYKTIRYRAGSSGTTGGGDPVREAPAPLVATPRSEARAPSSSPRSRTAPRSRTRSPDRRNSPRTRDRSNARERSNTGGRSVPRNGTTDTPTQKTPKAPAGNRVTPSSPTAASPPGAVGDIKPTKPAKPFEPGAPGPSTALPPDEGKPSGPLGNNPLAPVSGIADLTRGGGLPWVGLLIVLLASAMLAGAIAGWRWRHKLPFFKPVPDEARIAAFARVARSGADLQHRIAERRIAHGANGVNRRGALPVGTVAGPHGRANRIGNGVPAGAGGPNGGANRSEAGTNGATNGAGSDVATHREPASPG